MNRFETGSSDSLLRVSNVQRPLFKAVDSIIDIADLGNKMEAEEVVHNLVDTEEIFKGKEGGPGFTRNAPGMNEQMNYIDQVDAYNPKYVTEMDASDEEDTGDVAILFS